jgi:plasmid stabilization system protein ParE
MNFQIEFTEVAEMEAENILLWMNGISPERAEQWREGLGQAISTLSEFPRRCALAPENDRFEAEIRQLLYGQYRILFTLLDVDGDGDEETVHILHIRHGARSLMGHEETQEH